MSYLNQVLPEPVDFFLRLHNIFHNIRISCQGVALKSCTQFIKWLKEAEPEEEEDTEKLKVNPKIKKIMNFYS